METFDENSGLSTRHFTHAALIVIDQAQTEACLTRWSQIRSPHMGVAIFAHPDSDVSLCAREHGIRVAKIVQEFRREFVGDEDPLRSGATLAKLHFSDNALQCLEQAVRVAQARGVEQIDEKDIWRAILMDPSNFFVRILLANGIWPLWLLPYGW
jgi:ATP-dependent Clp protease ATP-binding subunit ClpA